eukprot:scaffold13485_cov126-Skeletonema_marinoi.AAC.1
MAMANAGQPPPSGSPAKVEDMNTKTAHAASAPAAAVSSGLELLFAASQVENKPKEAANAAVEADSAEAVVPSTITVYFRRVALFHSFIRKLNRYGFRRIKGSCKGEESSFAHNNFVRDKPWLCLEMNCKSKPSYHKGPSAKKKTTHHMTAATAVEAANSLTNTGRITMTMPAPVPPSFMGGVGGMIDASSRVFVATPTTYLPA